jgi:hypothetical protein
MRYRHETRSDPADQHGAFGSLLTVAAGVAAGMAVSQVLAIVDAQTRSGGRVRTYNPGEDVPDHSDPQAYQDVVVAVQQTTIGAPVDDPLGDEDTRRQIPGIPERE